MRFDASRTAANASGSRSSSVSPAAKRLRKSAVSSRNSSSVRSLKLGSRALIALAWFCRRLRVRPSPTRKTFSSTEATEFLHLVMCAHEAIFGARPCVTRRNCPKAIIHFINRSGVWAVRELSVHKKPLPVHEFIVNRQRPLAYRLVIGRCVS